MSELENLYWEYQGLIRHMEQYPAMYGFDARRRAIHKAILSHFPECDHERVTNVLHSLSGDMLFIDFEVRIRK